MNILRALPIGTANKMLFYFLFSFFVLITVGCDISPLNVNQSSAISVTGLKVEYSESPLGIDVKTPRFNWQMVAPEGKRDYLQVAYQITVKDPAGKVVWDTGKIENGESLGITYAGEPIKAATKYNWMVTVWDNHGDVALQSSVFETGLMNPEPQLSAWDGAQWIGGGDDDLILYSHYLSVFRLKYSLQLDKASNSTKAGFIFGANDSRLLDKNMNFYNIETKRDGHYIKIELDISAIDGSDTGLAKLNIYRVGYAPNDSADTPLQSYNIQSSVINENNKYNKHDFQIGSVFGQISINLNGNNSFASSSSGSRTTGRGGLGRGAGGGSVSLNVNPVGSGGDYISFPMLADIGFSVDEGQKAFFSNLEVMNYRSPSNKLFGEDLTASNYDGIYSGFVNNVNSGFSVKNAAYILTSGREGILIIADPSHNSMPMLRTEFKAKKRRIEKARMYVTARGIYEIYINGQRIGDDYFNPGLTQYNITHMYQTYDVTDKIITGSENAVGAWLGEGWWSGNYTFTGSNWNYFGDRQSLLAKLVITYNDGTTQVITTNSKDWKYYNNGPVLYGSFFQGEAYDARKEAAIKDWHKPTYNDDKWKQAAEVPLEGTTFTSTSSSGGISSGGINYDGMSLIGQIGENAGIVKTLKAQSVNEVRPGVFVYDMEQNMVGVPRITVTGAHTGDIIRIRYAEMLYPDMEEYKGNTGMVMLENLRAAHAQDTYILKEGDNIIQPRFTFHGYRYLEITGIDKQLPLNAVEGKVISSVRKLAASYETSNEKVNRLWNNIVWSQYGNFLTIPTDCPQRNERMGWSGDISVFSRTATYLANVNQFFRRHLFAMRDTQRSDGRFTDVAPVGGGFGGILWGSAGITIPWEAYQQYNDTGLLKEHYNAMIAYIDYISTTINQNTGLSSDGQLGDWLGPQNNMLGSAFLATAYHIYDLWIVASTAEILGKNEDAQKYWKMYKERKEFFNSSFINENNQTLRLGGGGRSGFGGRGEAGSVSSQVADTQTSYAVGLALGAFSDDKISNMAEKLADTVKRYNTDDQGVTRPVYSLMTGFIGTAWINKSLSDYGYNDLAYELLQNNQYPSWLYAIDQGATTIWERLNGFTLENGFGGNNSMNSFNHYSFGAVGQWMIAYSLGIQRDEPGFKKFILQPEPDPTGQMTWAKGYYDSMYGKIQSEWKVTDNILTFSATVPANTTATLYLPTKTESSVLESGISANKADGVTFIKYEKGKAVYELQSGSYKFVSDI